eukprot:TCALIF_12677-PA protein Name:"Protein of unknown function" AED:0.12 eAED:0.12 QI:45/0.71/0.62/1/1/0.87/8/0/595
MQSSYIHDRVCESLPRMRNLVQINLPQVATDKLCFLISEHLPLIRELNLDHSRVTDKGIKFLCGIKTLMGKSSPSEGQSQSSDVDQALQEQAALSVWHATTTESTMVARSISFESPCTTSSPIGSPGGSAGREKYCSQIQKLSLDGCLNLSESVIWLALKKLNTLKMLKYHHAFSVAEIMNKELNNLSSEEVAQLHFKLIHYNHPFPYGINVPTSLVQRISAVCPNITELNIVTEDSCVEAFSHMKHLKSVSIELEDWFGLGLFGFLKTMGSQIQELAISCSSDAEASFPPGGGQAFQLFNTGLKLARALCDPDSLKKLNIAGSGLVTNGLMEKCQEEATTLRQLSSLETLVFLAYDDESPVQSRCVKLQCLSLEGNFSSFMTHGFIMSLLAKNPLEQLGIFDIGGADIALGPQTALLLLKLPNILELRLSTWKLSDQDFNSLKTFVKDHGFHVYLTRGGPKGVSALQCAQCTSELSPRCKENPGSPQECQGDMKYCITIREYLRNDSRSIFDEDGGHVPPTEDEDDDSFFTRRSLVFMARSCVKFFGGNNCDEGVKEGQLRTICKEYCRTDGCNHAASAESHMAQLLFVLISMI